MGFSSSSVRHANWDFEGNEPGEIASGFTCEAGRWEVATDDGNHVLAQRAANRVSVFNLTLVNDTSYKNVDLSVRMKAVAGENEGGGGLVWRVRDKDNYYMVRYNPLVARHNPRPPSFCVYKVENGKLTQLDHANAPAETINETLDGPPVRMVWHTLRITMNGNEIVGYLDGKRLLEAEDSTFSDVGMIGLWSKSDARSYFDDLSISTHLTTESQP
jgi:hypothetical protein